jgi:xanthine/CO dehydrogenase XdhC/CoxF family maturation factor
VSTTGLGIAEDDILGTALRWYLAGHKVVLATVLNTWGSAPCHAGSRLVLREDGSFEGSVSGGCVEAAVLQAGFEVMRDLKPRKLEFGVTNEQAWSFGVACGGRIEILLEGVVQADPQ